MLMQSRSWVIGPFVSIMYSMMCIIASWMFGQAEQFKYKWFGCCVEWSWRLQFLELTLIQVVILLPL